MGRTIEKVKIRNYGDIYNVSIGNISESEIREMEIDAVVDSGAAFLCLPPKVISQLGLLFSHTRPVITANGKVVRRVFSGAEITILDRTTEMQVMENDGTTPSLIGYLVLEDLDFVVDPKKQRLIGNPEHDGEWLTDLY